MSYRTAIFSSVLFLSTLFTLNAQTQAIPPTDWFLLDPESDHLQGVSAEKTYQSLLKDQPSRTVIVAIVDSGVDIDHEDLKNVIWTNDDETPGNGIDDDHNGFVDDTSGWDLSSNDNNPDDGNGHGTHVAGIIAADANGVGSTGVALKGSCRCFSMEPESESELNENH